MMIGWNKTFQKMLRINCSFHYLFIQDTKNQVSEN
jgi:hypothetical protein